MDVGAPAVVAAIHDAVGVWIHDLPATPERIVAALTDAPPPPPPGISLEEPAPRIPPIEDGPPGGDEGRVRRRLWLRRRVLGARQRGGSAQREQRQHVGRRHRRQALPARSLVAR